MRIEGDNALSTVLGTQKVFSKSMLFSNAVTAAAITVSRDRQDSVTATLKDSDSLRLSNWKETWP